MMEVRRGVPLEIPENLPLLKKPRRGLAQAFAFSFSPHRWKEKIQGFGRSFVQKVKNFGGWWVDSWKGIKEKFSRHFIQQPVINAASGFFAYCYYKIASYKLADFSLEVSIPCSLNTMLVNGGLMDLTLEDIFKKMEQWSEKGWKKFSGHLFLYLFFIALAVPAASPLFVSAIEAELGLAFSYVLLSLRACAIGRSLVTFPDFMRQVKKDYEKHPALFWGSGSVALLSAGFYTYSQLAGMKIGKEFIVGEWGGEVADTMAQILGASVAGIFNFEWLRGGVEEAHYLTVESTAPAATFLLALGSGFVGLAQATTQAVSSHVLGILEAGNALLASVLMNFRSSWRNREESGALISRAIHGTVGMVEAVSFVIFEGLIQNIITRPLGWMGAQILKRYRLESVSEEALVVSESTASLISASLAPEEEAYEIWEGGGNVHEEREAPEVMLGQIGAWFEENPGHYQDSASSPRATHV